MKGWEVATLTVLLVAAILVMLVHVADLKAESAAAQIAPTTWQQQGAAALVVLDSPPKGFSEWNLLVKVGDAEFEIPRVALRKLVVAHPEWMRPR